MKNVIIIGSGIGGLIAGNLLAKKGHNVTIFESHSMPGGYTAGFYRKGYYFGFTHNTDGATSAWSWNPNKKFYKNNMSVNIETPVKKLYIGSCWASQIGGVPGALAAAYQCVKKIK